MNLPFVQLDVFAPTPFSGNPLAVVFDADALDSASMQAIAAWLGLSETTFVLRPTETGADYRLRIFTPGGELPFAGHPTLGTCAAWLQRGGVPARADVVMQQSAIGLVPVKRSGLTTATTVQRLAFAAPPMRPEAVEPGLLGQVCTALGLAPADVRASAWLDNGPRWLALWLGAASTVLQLEPDHAALRRLHVKVGVAAPQAPGHETAIEVRAFASPVGVPEDPVTGSLNASLAQWLIGNGERPAQYVAAQGTRLGRSGRVHIAQDAQGQVWVGGYVRAVLQGQIDVGAL
uniref:Phenazine biosynthesis protein, PhzF family n=1 Tax=mine drainage metagenome TaxID=410659 RepID=E6PUP0_9ZZZZ